MPVDDIFLELYTYQPTWQALNCQIFMFILVLYNQIIFNMKISDIVFVWETQSI